MWLSLSLAATIALACTIFVPNPTHSGSPPKPKFAAWTPEQLKTVEDEIQPCIDKAFKGRFTKPFDRKVKDIFCDPTAASNIDVAFFTNPQERRDMPGRIGNFIICLQKKHYKFFDGSRISWGLLQWWDAVKAALVGAKTDCAGMAALGINDDAKMEPQTTLFAAENFDPARTLQVVNLNKEAAELISKNLDSTNSAVKASRYYCQPINPKTMTDRSEAFMKMTITELANRKMHDQLKNLEKLLPIFNFVMTDESVCKVGEKGRSKILEKLEATNAKSCLTPLIALLSGDQERLRPLNKPDNICSDLLTVRTTATLPETSST